MAAAGEGLRARLVPRCIKCRERDAAALVNQTEALCALCLRGALLGKFKSAVNGGKLIAKDDHVLLAFSGGAASRCALDFLLAIQSPFLDSQGAAPLGAQGAAARGRIPFRLSVGHVDESVAVGNDLLPRGTADRLAGEMREVVRDAVATHREARAAGAGVGAGGGGGGDSGGGGGCAEGRGQGAARGGGRGGEEGEQQGVAVHVVPLESALAPGESGPVGSDPSGDGGGGSGDGGGGSGGGGGGSGGGGGGSGAERLAAQLAAAVAGAADGTGREDLVEAMRMDALHLLAYRVGCSKIVVGTTVTRMAARVIAATAKAQGFSLPTDLAVFDCRRPVPVLRPLRDCCQRDLALLAHLLRLQTVFLPSLATQASLRSSCPPGRRRGGGGGGAAAGAGSINALAASFMAGLNSANSGRQFTVTRTALKLQPFPFNRAPSLAPPSPSTADSPPLPLCAICLSPLPPPAHTPPTPSQPLSSAPSAPLCCSCRCGVMGEVGDGREGGRARGEERKEDGQEEAEGGGGRAEEGRAGEGKGCRELRSERAVEQLVGLPAAFLARGRGGSASYTEWLRQAERSMIADCLLEGQ
ncbi:hypothetical protein CLOM_g16964 [Closterium sp. NIES-68]|nr:hypothetical protein CLOM_g16964 [Closterium sp. NIES-68]GJP86456.1 hypothetical protein CLOP_g16481 [Closterium sp. NIES-67]